jgi:pimeloyl-ACP methyl ester carboxylesterase/alkylhydroperoxidase/carboxymuconolactone decarboxylase family protein YurZ
MTTTTEPSTATFEDRTVTVDGYDFHYLEAGTGVPLVFLHGGGGHRLTPFHELLADQHRVIMIEQPGFGASPEPSPPTDVSGYAAMVGGAARAIAGAPYHLVGTSFGGRIAARVAVDSPADVLTLSLLAPAILKREGGPAAPPAPDPSLSPEQVERFRQQLAFLGQLLRGGDPAELVAAVAGLPVPVSITFGADDDRVPAAMATTYAALLPAAEIGVVEDAGHVLYADQPAAAVHEVLRNIARWTAPVPGPRSWRQVLGAVDPVGNELLGAYLAHTLSPELGGINRLQGELIQVATATAVNEPLSIRTHVTRALEAGASDAQIYQAMLMGSSSGGVPSLQAGLRVLDELLDLR